MQRSYRLGPTTCASIETRWTPWHFGLGVSVRRSRIAGRKGIRINTWHVFVRVLWLDVTLATSESVAHGW